MARKRGITTLPGAGVNIEYSQNGTTYNEVPGCDNFDVPQGERESRTTRAFGGTRATTGGRDVADVTINVCLLYTSPSPRDRQKSRMPSSA